MGSGSPSFSQTPQRSERGTPAPSPPSLSARQQIEARLRAPNPSYSDLLQAIRAGDVKEIELLPRQRLAAVHLEDGRRLQVPVLVENPLLPAVTGTLHCHRSPHSQGGVARGPTRHWQNIAGPGDCR